MADYLELTRTTSSSDSGFWINGITLYSVQGVYNTAYRCAYYANSLYNIRAGVYRNFDRYNFVFVAENAINPIDIRLVFNNANDETIVVKTLDRIDTSFANGYRNGFAVAPDDPVINITVFSSLNECLEAIGFDGGGGGGEADIIVTISASSNPEDNVVLVDIGGTADGATLITVKIDGEYISNDTNAQGGTSEMGGGTGTFDDTSDVIPIPPLPSISAANSGLVTLFRPSLTQLQALGAYLWTNITDFIENLNKLFMNPMDYLIALNIFPVNPGVGNSRAIKIGSFTTTIEMPPIISQWYEFDCGTIVLRPYWGSALDYAPNTKVSLFLPFIGSVQLNADEVMGNTIGIRYRFDLLSGQCVAMVTIDSSVWYQFTGEAGVSVPLTGADWSRVYSAAIGAVGTAITGGIGAAASGMATGSATAALAGARAADAVGNLGSVYSYINATSKGVKGVTAMREQMIQAAQMAINAGNQAAAAPAKVAQGVRASRIANTINNTIGSVMSGKMSVQHSGTISGSAGMLGVKTPYLCVEFPNQSLAQDYKHFVGYPSNIYARLGTLTGYTECESIYPSGLTGQTDAEVAELLESLKGGVYLNFNNVTAKGAGIVLYNYTTPPNTVGKGAVQVETMTGVFRDSVSVTDPTFTITRASPTGFNYVYIEAFDRFYYVAGVSADLHGVVTVSCTVDPLETNANIIAQMNAIIRRQENQYNLYLDDGIFKAYQNTKHKLIAFPNSFTEYSYVLTLAGNSE